MMRKKVPATVRARLTEARVAHLASMSKRSPHVIPVCFVFDGRNFYTAIDRKPKKVQAKELQRVRNIRAEPRAALLIDHYEEDWNKLWYILVRGRAVIISQSGREHSRAIRLLRRKYPQYRADLLPPEAQVLRITPEKIMSWGGS